MKYEDVKLAVKKHDLVELSTIYSEDQSKYIIVSITKDILVILPILEEEDEAIAAACPTLGIPYSLIASMSKIDNTRLIFYSNLNNKYIDEAIIGNIPKRTKYAKVQFPV